MGVDNQQLAALKRRRAQLLADGHELAEVDDDLARARGESPTRKIRKRAAAAVETAVDVSDVETSTAD